MTGRLLTTRALEVELRGDELLAGERFLRDLANARIDRHPSSVERRSQVVQRRAKWPEQKSTIATCRRLVALLHLRLRPGGRSSRTGEAAALASCHADPDDDPAGPIAKAAPRGRPARPAPATCVIRAD